MKYGYTDSKHMHVWDMHPKTAKTTLLGVAADFGGKKPSQYLFPVNCKKKWIPSE